MTQHSCACVYPLVYVSGMPTWTCIHFHVLAVVSYHSWSSDSVARASGVPADGRRRFRRRARNTYAHHNPQLKGEVSLRSNFCLFSHWPQAQLRMTLLKQNYQFHEWIVFNTDHDYGSPLRQLRRHNGVPRAFGMSAEVPNQWCDVALWLLWRLYAECVSSDVWRAWSVSLRTSASNR